jgi:tRNA(fMet)-specific endonuclease VapC
MILVDTSAWIAFFRDREPVARMVDALLEENQVALCGPVVTELRRGLRSKRERTRVLPLLAACHELTEPALLWNEAGDLGFTLARKGAHVKTLDLLIAVYALSHRVPLLTTDADFSLIRSAGVPLVLA